VKRKKERGELPRVGNFPKVVQRIEEKAEVNLSSGSRQKKKGQEVFLTEIWGGDGGGVKVRKKKRMRARGRGMGWQKTVLKKNKSQCLAIGGKTASGVGRLSRAYLKKLHGNKHLHQGKTSLKKKR